MWQKLLVLLLLTGQVFAAEAFKCKGKNGELIFSDQPCAANAETIQLKEPQTFSAPATQAGVTSAVNPDQPRAEKAGYKVFRVESPRAGEVFEGDTSAITVSIYVEPQLAESHKIQLYLNNKPYGDPANQFAWSLEDLERGDYQVKAELLDQRGRLLKSAQSNFVVIKRVNRKTEMSLPGNQSGTGTKPPVK